MCTLWKLLGHIQAIYKWHRQANYNALVWTWNSVCQLSIGEKLYTGLLHINTVFVMCMNLYRSCTSLNFMNFTGESWHPDFMQWSIIGHYNLLDDVICIWHVYTIARFCAIWWRIAVFTAFRNKLEGTYVLCTSTYSVYTKYWLNVLYGLKTNKVHTVHWLL